MLNRGAYAKRLHLAMKVLETLRNVPALAALFGVDGPESPILKRGWERYQAARAAHFERGARHGDALTAMAQCAASFEVARSAQARLVLLGRALFTKPADRDRLGLNGRRAEGLGAWLLQAEVFHTNLTDTDRSALAQFGVASAELERTRFLLLELAENHASCIAAKAAAKAATSAKITAFQELAAFLSPLIAVARGLEESHPKLPALLHMSPDGRRRSRRRPLQPMALDLQGVDEPPAPSADAVRSPSRDDREAPKPMEPKGSTLRHLGPGAVDVSFGPGTMRPNGWAGQPEKQVSLLEFPYAGDGGGDVTPVSQPMRHKSGQERLKRRVSLIGFGRARNKFSKVGPPIAPFSH